MKNKILILMLGIVLLVGIVLLIIYFPQKLDPSLSKTIDPSLSQELEGNWTIEGNSVYMNDLYAYISATPHTISGSGYIYFNLTSKIYEGDIDVYWGFDNSKIKPTKAEIFDGSDWIDISHKFDSKDYEYEGMNKWYFLKDVSVVQNQSYLLRAYIKLKPFTQGSKYWFALKPSSLTIQEAISSGHFYALDPWYDTIQSVYDEIDDSSFNTSLWGNSSTDTGSHSISQSTLTESADHLTSHLYEHIQNGQITATRNLWTTNLPDIEVIENLTMRVVLVTQRHAGSGPEPYEVRAKLYIFNNLIKNVQRVSPTSFGTTSDDSVWTAVRNDSCGTNCFSIFDDGVFEKSINATNNQLKVYNQLEVDPEYTHELTSYSRIYYVYYARQNQIILNSPEDNYISSTLSNVTINCSAYLYDGNNATNISLWENSTGTWILNQTNDTSALNLSEITQTFNLSVNNPNSTLWSCQACETSGDCDFAPENRTLLFDIVYPQINVTSPTGTYEFPILAEDIDLNWIITDIHLDSCWYEYNNANTSVNCGDNHTTFNLVIDIYNLTMWANDTLGNTNSSSITWNYSTSGFTETYNNETTEGSIETFSVNFSTSYQVSTGNLIYNGTSYPGSLSRTGSDPFNYTIQIDFPIPSVNADTNMTFNWIILLADSTQWNTTSHTQLIRNLGIDDCSSYTNILLNYTLYDEDSTNFLNNVTENTSIEVDINIYSLDDLTNPIIEYSHFFNETNPAIVCLENNLSTSNYYLYAKTKYSSLARRIEYHNIQRSQLNLSTMNRNVSLYDLTTATSTRFIITFKGDNFLPLADALIDITREYVGEGLFRSIEIPLTDVSGQAVASLRKDDTTYTIYVRKNGVLLATFENIVPVCVNELTDECEINLNSYATTTSPTNFYTYNNIAYSLDYDETARDITIQFTILDGSTSTILLESILYNRFENTTICDDTLTSSSGTLTCNVPITYANSTIQMNLYKDGDLISQSYLSLYPDTESFFGSTRIIFVIILMLTIPFMFITSLVGMVIGGIIGLIVATLLLLSTGGTSLGITASILWLVVSGAIIIWRLTRGGQSD